LLQLEGELDTKCVDWLFEETRDRPTLEREMRAARSAKSHHALHAFIAWRLFHQRDSDALTAAQRLERAASHSLKNDQRVLLRAKMQAQVALVEVRCVLDSEQTELADLLAAEPRPFVVRDRGLASNAARFVTLLCWSYPLPHFHRISGTAILLPDVAGFEPVEIVTEIVRHLGGPVDASGMRLWLAEHFARFDLALTAVNLERRRLMFENIDAKFGKAVYELRRPFADCREQLDAVAEVAPDDLAEGEEREGFAEARVWFAGEADDHLVGGGLGQNRVVGRVLLGQAHWRLEAMGAEKLSALRERFERTLGSGVSFTGERLDDLAASMRAKDPKADLSLVPPRLLENPQRIRLVTSRVDKPVRPVPDRELTAQLVEEQERAWLDEPIEALGGLTPRAAARDAKWRPALIRLMKSRVRSCDEHNLRDGTNEDVNWMLRELGLTEILFDPPPPDREPSELPEWAEDGKEADDDDEDFPEPVWQSGADLPPAPPLPPGPFSHDYVAACLERTLEDMGTGRRTLEEAEAEGCTIVGTADEATVGLLEDEGFTLLAPFLVMAWEVFVPRGTRGPDIETRALQLRIRAELEGVLRALKTGATETFARQFESGSQPALTGMLTGLVLDAVERLPKKQRPDANASAVIVVVLRAVIEELDAACRRG
jgi:hypothetical protein